MYEKVKKEKEQLQKDNKQVVSELAGKAEEMKRLEGQIQQYEEMMQRMQIAMEQLSA